MKVYKKCGITYIQPPWGTDFYPKGVDRFKVFEVAKKHGISIDVIHFDYSQSNKLWLEGPEGDNFIDTLTERIRECVSRGIRIGVLHMTTCKDTPIPAVSAIGLSRVKRLVEFCEKHDFIIAAENIDATPHQEYVLDNIKSKHLKMLFDISHAHCKTKDEFHLFEKYNDRVICTHLNNTWGDEDLHNSLDDGIIDFEKFFSLKSSVQYHLLEVAPHGITTAEQFKVFVRHNVELLKRYLVSTK